MADVTSRPAGTTPGRSRRRVSVAGVSGGVGTTTLAAAIGGTDCGVFTGRPVDVLVCRATVESLQRAGQAARLQTDRGARRPVLAVIAVSSGGSGRAVTARMRLTSAYTTRVVAVPLVRRWRDSTASLQDARSALSTSPGRLPRALRGYARAAAMVRADLGPPVAPDRVRRTPDLRGAAAGRSR